MAFISKKVVVPFFSPLAKIERSREKTKSQGILHLHLYGWLLPFLFLFSLGYSQTFTSLSPTGDGGFENGNDFYLNNWIPVQPASGSRWFARAIVPSPYAGSRAAYVGSSSNYDGSATAGVFHFYRDIPIPAGAINVHLSFYYKQPTVDNTTNPDTFYVFTTTPSNTPVSGTVPTTGYTQRFSNSATQYNNWTLIPTINLSSLAGTTIRLVFSFRNNGNLPNANPAVDYISLSYIIPCTGTPSGGTTNLSPTSGAPSSTFNASVTGGSSTGEGLSYQWQIATATGGPWTNIAGATGASASLTAVPFAGTTRYYRRRIRCSYSGMEAFSTTASFTTNSVTYCTPTSQVPGGLYINNLQVFGMTDTPANITTYASNGYSNFTANNALIVKQAQGEGINIEAFAVGQIMTRGRWKAWVDWNGDGDFTDSGEEIFNVGGIVGENAGFGFAIPANQTPGKYRMRVRINNSRLNGGTETYGFDFSPCDNFTTTTGGSNTSNYGETEDYLIEVVENCVAKIATVVPGSACNTPAGTTVGLTATSNQPVTEFRWYTTPSGGSYVTTLPDGTGMSTTWTTPTISQTTTYYVTAFNGTCESTFRTEITAEVLPTPEIEFTSSSYDICGENSIVEVSALGENEIVHLIDVDFEDGTLGGFLNQRITTNTTPEVVDFINRTSVYKPDLPNYKFWRPAISSGFGPNKFVLANSDANVGFVERALRAPLSINTEGLETLTLSFRMYFSRYNVDGVDASFEYVTVEVSNNNGSSWTELERFTRDIGRAGKFEVKTYNLNAYINQNNLTFRFRLYSNPNGSGWLASGLALDDIELYGEKPLEPSFDWVSDNSIGVFTDPEGTIPYEGEPISKVYFIPTPEELIAFETWDVTATAELENGCTASGNFELSNSTKFWDASSGTWSVNNWKPGTAVPTADNCVIIRTPVSVPNLTNGLAKNLKVETGGSLTIQSGASLTVTDFVMNEATAADFVVESDASLVQVSPGSSNTGEITLRRAATVPSNQYNYWASPVVGQLLYNLYPNIPNNRIMTYNTWDDYFTILPKNTHPISSFGIGYAVKGPTSNSPLTPGGGTGVVASFIGVPQNESLIVENNHIPLSNEGNGYNLIGNPYPSNLNLDVLYNLPSNQTAIDATFHFWDNTYNTVYVQQGSSYVGGNYAFYNVNSGGTPASGGDDAKIPNGIVKPGQGFIVQSLSGSPILLANAMRTKDVKIDVGDPDAPYYKNGNGFATDDHHRQDKFWLDLVTPTELHVKILIGYFEEAEDTFEKFDSRILSESLSDNFYSLSKDAEKLAIQGRQGLFHDDDVVPLGVKTFHSGKHTIQLQERLGLFINHQDIYLKDKYLGIIHNLSESDYEIDLQNGLVEDRFEIVFKDGNSEEEPILTAASQVNIQKIDKQILITSSKDKIQEVEIFNLAGWSVYTKTRINANEFRIPVKNFDHQIIVVKVRTETGEIVTKKLVN